MSFLFPPFAVVDKGCGVYLLTFVLTCLGWVPGIISALVILKLEQRKNNKNGAKASKQVARMQNQQSRNNNPRVGKLQSRISSKNNKRGSNAWTDNQQSPFNRKRRMNNNDNNHSQGWQKW